jgi:hypothetical protein
MDKLIDKIKKLLALAESGNEHEAKLAAQRATELLTKHNLNMQQVQRSNDYTEEELFNQKAESTETKFVGNLICQYFFVKLLKTRDRINKRTIYTVFGTPENVEIASYMYGFLVREFRQLWRNYKGECRQSFYIGLYGGLRDQLEEAKTKIQNETGLVVVPDKGIDRYINDRHRGVRSGGGLRPKARSARPKARSAADINAGRVQGQNIQIRRGVNSSHQGATLRLGGKS